MVVFGEGPVGWRNVGRFVGGRLGAVLWSERVVDGNVRVGLGGAVMEGRVGNFGLGLEGFGFPLSGSLGPTNGCERTCGGGKTAGRLGSGGRRVGTR